MVSRSYEYKGSLRRESSYQFTDNGPTHDLPQSEGIGAAEMEKMTGVSEPVNKNGYLPISELPSSGKSGRSSMVIF